MARIFLSHSSRNNAEAVALGDWLTADGWDDLFLDLDPSRGIAAGERWERSLYEAANRCEAVLFLVSRAWLQSDWCLREFRLAQKLNKRSFGILVEPIPVRDLPAELTANWQFVDLAQGADHRIFRAVLPDGSESHVTFSTSGLQRLKTGLTRAGLDARFFQWPPDSDPDRPPYRGMRPLEAEDAGIFYGREAPTIEALDRLRGLSEAAPPRFLVILGASGAGKSSFLRAGLLPRLARDDRNFLPLPIVRPERAALTGETGLIRSLEAAVKAAGLKQTRAEIKAVVESGAPGLAVLLERVAAKARFPANDDGASNRRNPSDPLPSSPLQGEGALGLRQSVHGDDDVAQSVPPTPPPPARGRMGGGHLENTAPPRIVLAIDQAEELFLAEGAAEAAAFLRLVRDLTADPASNLIVVATIRSDAYERLQTAPALEGVRQETLSLPPLPRGAYQTVIEGPAARLAETPRPLRIEPALTAALLADIEAGGAKDALPLLAFTLERLYLEHGGDGDLRLSEYRQIGGIKGSIDAAVEGALRAADADPAVPRDRAAREALLRRALIPWLAGIDPETGAPRRRVARLSEIPGEARPLVSHLIAARLLATDRNPDTGETTVEPAHEALLRQWGLLQGWLEEDFAALSALEGVKRATRDWESNARSPDWLSHAAGRLDDAEALLARDDFAASLDPTDRAYLAAARAADTARRDRELEEARKLAAAQKDAADRQRQVARRTRIGLIAASLLAVVAISAAVFGFYQAQRADEQAAFATAQADLAGAQRLEAERQADIAEEQSLEAERQRADAEAQKQAAEDAQAVAESERAAAELARADAEREKQRAEDNFAAAKKAVNSLIFDVADGLQNVTGMRVETIRKILDTVRATVDRLAETAPDDPELQRSQVWMYVFFADTYLAAGAVSDALALAEAGLAIARKLAEADPANAGAQRDLSVSLNWTGNVKLRGGDRAGALAAFEQYLDIARKLAEADPSNAQAQRDLQVSLTKIGDVKLQGGDRAGALAALEESLIIARMQAEADPGNAEARRDLSVSLNWIGNMKLQAGDREGALAAFEQYLDIARKLAEADPSNAQAQRDLQVSLTKIGDVKLQGGDRAGALAAHEESLVIARMQAEADPGNAEAQRDLSVSLNWIGNMKLQAGDREGALAAYEQYLDIARKLAEADPGNAEAQRDLSVSLEKLGNAKLPAGDDEGALAAHEESLAIRRKLAEADPGNAEAQRDLSVSLNKVGDVKLQAGDRAGALAAYDEGLIIARKLAEADPGNAEAQRDLSVSLNWIGNMKLQAGDRAGALAAYDESLAIRRKLAEDDPDDAGAQNDLVNALGSFAFAAVIAERFTQAESLSREGIALAPNQIWLQTNLAHALMLQDKPAEADAIYLGNRGRMLANKTWQQVILDDFAALREAGIAHPHMAELEAAFGARRAE